MKTLSVFLLALLCSPIFAQVAPLIPPRQQFADANGKPLAGGCLYSYQPSSSVPLATYADSTGTAENTNPVLLDSAGRASIWLGAQAYRLTLYSAGGINCVSGSFVWTEDNVSSSNFFNYPAVSAQFLDLTTSNATISNATIGSATVSNSMHLSNPGVFTNDQMHQYVTSFIGGIAPDMYHSVQGFPGYATESGTFGVAVPSNATANEIDAVVGMVTSACNSFGRTTCNSVAVSGHAQAIANGAGVWGQNTTVSNSIGTTATNLVGNEIDIGINGDQSLGYIHGLDIFLSPAPGSTMPTNVGSPAITIANSNKNGQWSQGIYIWGDSIQSSGNALYVGSACDSGPCSSAKLTLTGVDSGSTPHFGSLSVNSNGGWNIVSTAGQPAVFSSGGAAIDGATSGALTLKTQSATPSGTLLLPTPVGSGVVAQLIGSGTAASAGTSIGSGAAQAVVITVTGATTTDVATCSTNAAYGANWALISVLPPIVTTDTVTLNIVNPSSGSVTPAAQTFRCAVRR